MKAKLFIALPFSLYLAGCSPSGFSTLNLSGGGGNAGKGPGVEASSPTATMASGGPLGGQPGSVTLAGSLVQSDASGLKPKQNIKISQTTGKSTTENAKSEIQAESKIQLQAGVQSHHLNQIQDRIDYALIGCSPQQAEVAGLIRGLKPTQVNFELKEFLNIKAKVVVLCGKVNLAQSFVSIVAEQLVLMNFSFEIQNPTGVGAFSAMARRINLQGQNSISSKGQDAAGAIVDAPSIFLAAQNDLTGNGSLDLKTTGGSRLVSGK